MPDAFDPATYNRDEVRCRCCGAPWVDHPEDCPRHEFHPADCIPDGHVLSIVRGTFVGQLLTAYRHVPLPQIAVHPAGTFCPGVVGIPADPPTDAAVVPTLAELRSIETFGTIWEEGLPGARTHDADCARTRELRCRAAERTAEEVARA